MCEQYLFSFFWVKEGMKMLKTHLKKTIVRFFFYCDTFFSSTLQENVMFPTNKSALIEFN